MSAPKFDFGGIVRLLRRSENDPEVRSFFGQALSQIERDEHYGSLEFKQDGVDVVFKEAPWAAPPEEIEDQHELYVVAFHLHREGHEGFAGYSGQLPKGVILGDPETEVLRKMGSPSSTGGGGISNALKRAIPRWSRYPLGNGFLHLQLDPADRVEMVTLDGSNNNAECSALSIP